MTNLLTETLQQMMHYGLWSDDIIYIGTNPNQGKPCYSCIWGEFVDLANFDYDNGFGSVEVNENLIIIFNNGTFMDRGEYDGSEWWNVYISFKIPKETEPLTKEIITSPYY